MESEKSHRKILVCGAGNGAHCLAGLASLLPNTDVRVLSLYADEAFRWKNISDENDGIHITATGSDGTVKKHKSKPSMITNDPKAAIKGTDIIFIIVPAFAHAQYLEALLPHIQPNTLIVGLPGQAGFEFQCRHILGPRMRQTAIVSFESLPWSCRILEFGKHVEILGFKETLGASIIKGRHNKLPFCPFEELQIILGKEPKVKIIQNCIAVTLMAKSIVHPPLMYGRWNDWDNQPLDKKQLFYQAVDTRQADLLAKTSDEVVKTAKAIEKQKPEVDMSAVIHVFDWYKEYYKSQIADDSSLMMAMRTNKAYEGILHPMKEIDRNKFVPDFNYRYLSEDIPYGLVVMKGIAELVGVETPVIDEIIDWCQTKLQKQYIIGNKLNGVDLKETRAPQCFEMKTLDDLFVV